jgi:hypothetical protein
VNNRELEKINILIEQLISIKSLFLKRLDVAFKEPVLRLDRLLWRLESTNDLSPRLQGLKSKYPKLPKCGHLIKDLHLNVVAEKKLLNSYPSGKLNNLADTTEYDLLNIKGLSRHSYRVTLFALEEHLRICNEI